VVVIEEGAGTTMTTDSPPSAAPAGRPIPITVVCIVLAFGVAFAIPMVLGEAAQSIRGWYPPLLGLSTIVGGACTVGFWRMRRWAVYVYTALAVTNQFVLLALGVWSLRALILPAIVIAIGSAISARRTRSIGSVIASRLRSSATSSSTRASNVRRVTVPTRNPNTFREPRTEFSRSKALVSSCWRLTRSMRTRCACSLLTWTCRLVDERGIEPHIPVFDKSQRTDGTFSRDDFTYDHTSDTYRCPSGKTLRRYRRRFTTPRTGVMKDNSMRYRASKRDCEVCPLKPRCCPVDDPRDIVEGIGKRAAIRHVGLAEPRKIRRDQMCGRRSGNRSAAGSPAPPLIPPHDRRR
jgi:hypothetical protein